MTGASFFSRASWVRLRPNWSSTIEPEASPLLLPVEDLAFSPGPDGAPPPEPA